MTALDALNIINLLSRSGVNVISPAPVGPPYFDASGDGQVSPLDALRVINFISQK